MPAFSSPYEAELDPFFQAAGLASRPLGLRGRTYEGRLNGRNVRLDASTRTVNRYAGEVRYREYRGHRFDFTVSIDPSTRLVAAPSLASNSFARRINAWYGLSRVETRAPELAHLEIWALEPDWAQRWLAAPETIESLARLLPPDPGARLRAISMRPGGGLGFGFKSPIRSVQRNHLAQWMNDLFALARAADAVPPPRQRAEPGRAEQFFQEKPMLGAVGILLGLMAVLVLLTGVLLVGLFLLVTIFRTTKKGARQNRRTPAPSARGPKNPS